LDRRASTSYQIYSRAYPVPLLLTRERGRAPQVYMIERQRDGGRFSIRVKPPGKINDASAMAARRHAHVGAADFLVATIMEKEMKMGEGFQVRKKDATPARELQPFLAVFRQERRDQPLGET
jgi:hypothetical protein